jgi:hypothetical protein
MIHWDWTINPANLVAWGLLVGGIVWRAGGFISEMRGFMTRFQEHEEKDDERFKTLDARFEGVHRRLDDLREIITGRENRPGR